MPSSDRQPGISRLLAAVGLIASLFGVVLGIAAGEFVYAAGSLALALGCVALFVLNKRQ